MVEERTIPLGLRVSDPADESPVKHKRFGNLISFEYIPMLSPHDCHMVPTMMGSGYQNILVTGEVFLGIEACPCCS